MFEVIEPTLSFLEYKMYPLLSRLQTKKKKTLSFDKELLEAFKWLNVFTDKDHFNIITEEKI